MITTIEIQRRLPLTRPSLRSGHPLPAPRGEGSHRVPRAAWQYRPIRLCSAATTRGGRPHRWRTPICVEPPARRKKRQAEDTPMTFNAARSALSACFGFALIALAGFPAAPARAQDQLKVAIGQINNWENQAPTLGQDAGIFKRHNLVLENVGTQGAGETLQPVISGSADLGAGVGVAGVMRAFARGAPVRILLPAFTGTGDLFWYVKADSPLKSVKDITAGNTIAYSTSGSSSNNLVLAFIDELGVKAKPTATGGPAGTLTQVMSGQIDIGWAAPPFGMKELKEGKIRILIRGSDVPSLRGQTVRTIIVNADA